MRKLSKLLSLIAVIFSVCRPAAAQTLEPLSPAPAFGTFYFASGGPPFPFDPSVGQLPVYEWRPGVYVVDDSGGSLLAGGAMTMSDPLPSPCTQCPTNGTAGGPIAWGGNYDHSSNDLWLEIRSVVMSNSTATFVIHTPETNGIYDLFSTTNMTLTATGLNQTNWVWLMRTAAGQTNLTRTNILSLEGWFQLGTMADGDLDSLTSAYEALVTHTNPNLLDTDGDSIPDGWEVLHGLNPLVNDANADPDGDGLTNLQEYFGGTNPFSADNLPPFLVVPKPGSILP